MKNYAAIALVLMTMTGGAQAYTIDVGSSVLGGNVVSDYSGIDNVSFDIDYGINAPIRLNVVRQAGDTASAISLSSIVNNLSGFGWQALQVKVSGNATLAQAGTVFSYAGLSNVATTTVAGITTITFPLPETAGVEIGNVFGALGIDPWVIDVSGLAIGGRFSIELAPSVSEVPLPAAAWLMGSALLGLGTLRRRRA